MRLVEALGDRDLFGENVDFLFDAGPSVVQRVDEFFEIEQPERQLQGRGVDDVGARAEAASVFVVAVEQENAQVRPDVEDFVEHHRHAARLSDAGRTKHGEMLAQEVVDVDAGGDRIVEVKDADIDRAGAGGLVDEPQFVAPDDSRGVADRRIGRHAAREAFGADGVHLDFARQVDSRHGANSRVGFGVAAACDFCDHADQATTSGRDRQERADGGTRLLADRGRRQADARLRAAHAQHRTERRRLDRRA